MMSEEIKEVLEYLKNDNWNIGNGDYEKILYRYEIKNILSYINFLQEENKQLKKDKKNAIDYIKENSQIIVPDARKIIEILGDKENE